MMSSGEAHKLNQRTVLYIRKGNGSEDIDPDDQELTEGPSNEGDLAVYQQTFVKEGKNVNKSNMESEKNAVEKLENRQYTPEEMNSALTDTAPVSKPVDEKPQSLSVFYVSKPRQLDEDKAPKKFVAATTDEEARELTKQL